MVYIVYIIYYIADIILCNYTHKYIFIQYIIFVQVYYIYLYI